jgi:hypothetical protein
MNKVGLTFIVMAFLFLLIPISSFPFEVQIDPPDCHWPEGAVNLKLHGYTINKLSKTGIARSVAQLHAAGKNLRIAPTDGYFASTHFFWFVADGHRINGEPTDRALIVLVTPRGECLGGFGGTVEQMTYILDGSADKLSGSFTQ